MAPSYSALAQTPLSEPTLGRAIASPQAHLASPQAHLAAPQTDSAPQQADSAEAIDLVHLARQSLGDKDLETELLRLFAHQTEQLLPQMAPEKAESPARLADLAHTLKGSARAVGAVKIAQTADDYESLARRAPAAPRELAEAYAALSQAAVHARKTIADLLSE